MVMQSMMKQYHRDFVHRVRSDRFSPCVTAVPHRRRTSEHVQAFDHEGTLTGSHWLLHPSQYHTPPLHALVSASLAHVVGWANHSMSLFSLFCGCAVNLYSLNTLSLL